ncbi:unnamed protein product [Paramecium primaurelia]|uniref:Uncharacterized protein n=1 Tax=Paramecium primaurelia TaxID=5886 RepID=A0A8S1K8E0_PARPR|nr:unnamed protein product [Paramecium primaurelia]
MDLPMEILSQQQELFQILLGKSRTKRLINQCQRLILTKLVNQQRNQFKLGFQMKFINHFHPLLKSINFLTTIMLQQLILVKIYFCDLRIIFYSYIYHQILEKMQKIFEVERRKWNLISYSPQVFFGVLFQLLSQVELLDYLNFSTIDFQFQ